MCDWFYNLLVVSCGSMAVCVCVCVIMIYCSFFMTNDLSLAKV